MRPHSPLHMANLLLFSHARHPKAHFSRSWRASTQAEHRHGGVWREDLPTRGHHQARRRAHGRRPMDRTQSLPGLSTAPASTGHRTSKDSAPPQPGKAFASASIERYPSLGTAPRFSSSLGWTVNACRCIGHRMPLHHPSSPGWTKKACRCIGQRMPLHRPTHAAASTNACGCFSHHYLARRG